MGVDSLWRIRLLRHSEQFMRGDPRHDMEETERELV